MFNVYNIIMSNIRRGYCRYIGSGSGRDVFDLGNGYVAKVAKNRAGIAQNKCEYRISANDNSDLFAKVIKISNNYKIVIMEKAEGINNISYVWRYFNVANKKELFNLREIQNLKRKYNLLLGDFNRESSWGIINGRPVIIDYGFTRDIKARYY